MIKSMTAFARHHEHSEEGDIVWELRAVNHRYLDVHLHVPDMCRDSEMAIRECVRGALSRGKIDVMLRYVPNIASGGHVALNIPLVKQLGVAVDELRQFVAVQDHIPAFELLRWPGVVMMAPCDQAALTERLQVSLKVALASLVSAREREGERLMHYLLDMLKSMQEQVDIVTACSPMVVQENREKLQARFSTLSLEVDAQRIEQEIVLLIQRWDVAEECQRLVSHLMEVKALLQKGGVQGRRLDFLMQELHREANTLSAKSVDTVMTQAAVTLKVLIEQMREQVQNIE